VSESTRSHKKKIRREASNLNEKQIKNTQYERALTNQQKHTHTRIKRGPQGLKYTIKKIPTRE
jgi:uncharacterized protein (DUF3084 family)